MTKSKKSVEKKLDMNAKYPDTIGTAIERRSEKDLIPESGKFAGLGYREHNSKD
jgi:hypothetical protein